MSNYLAKRIMRELDELSKSGEIAMCSINAYLIGDSFKELRGEIAGPPGSPYEGGKFLLEIKIPPDYPIVPPTVRFLTKVWHPNVSSISGIVCINILKEQWSPMLNIRTILLSVQQLLISAEPTDPQDPRVGSQFLNNYNMFELTAKHWTNVFAGGPYINLEFDEKIQKLVEDFNVEEHEARIALSYFNWFLPQAMAAAILMQ